MHRTDPTRGGVVRDAQLEKEVWSEIHMTDPTREGGVVRDTQDRSN